ncbi:MAG TPA: hypothetical protein VLZ33_02300, partial [Dysgonamonadaceae bacterium]|nr:hypothetical protein [Dysgonamonadaceae bacterium]
ETIKSEKEYFVTRHSPCEIYVNIFHRANALQNKCARAGNGNYKIKDESTPKSQLHSFTPLNPQRELWHNADY